MLRTKLFNDHNNRYSNRYKQWVGTKIGFFRSSFFHGEESLWHLVSFAERKIRKQWHFCHSLLMKSGKHFRFTECFVAIFREVNGRLTTDYNQSAAEHSSSRRRGFNTLVMNNKSTSSTSITIHPYMYFFICDVQASKDDPSRPLQ